MRLGTVIGRITLTPQEPVYAGGRLLIVQPWTRNEFARFRSNVAAPPTARTARQGARLPASASVVVYDELGAGQGCTIGFTEGAEAAQPFTGDAPVDAYCVCIVDQLSYGPPS